MYVLVVLPELFQHHALLGVKAEGEEERHGDAVGRTRNPVGNHEGLAQRIEKERRVHGVAHGAIDALGDELVSFPHLQGDRPVGAQVRVRPREEPQPRDEANDARQERARGEADSPRTRSTGAATQTSGTKKASQANVRRTISSAPRRAPRHLHPAAPLPMRGADDHHRHAAGEDDRLPEPGAHAPAPPSPGLDATASAWREVWGGRPGCCHRNPRSRR